MESKKKSNWWVSYFKKGRHSQAKMWYNWTEKEAAREERVAETEEACLLLREWEAFLGLEGKRPKLRRDREEMARDFWKG